MQHTPTITGKSLTSVVWQKMVETVDRSTVPQLLTWFGLCLLAGAAAAAWINVEATMALVLRVSDWKGGAVPKAAIAFALVFNGKRICRSVYHWLLDQIEFLSGVPTCDTLEGVPTAELLDHLFQEKSFRRDDVEAKFGIPRYRVTALTKKLREIGVLVVGPNNLSTLNPDFTRQDVASVFRPARTAEDLQPLFRQKDAGTYTSEPSGPEVLERVGPLLSPASGFTRREVQMA